jgi:hypothetical protein
MENYFIPDYQLSSVRFPRFSSNLADKFQYIISLAHNSFLLNVASSSHSPLVLLFYAIYIIHSICSPLLYTFLSRFTILEWTAAQQSVILCLMWRSSRIITAYACAFRNPPKCKVQTGWGLVILVASLLDPASQHINEKSTLSEWQSPLIPDVSDILEFPGL